MALAVMGASPGIIFLGCLRPEIGIEAPALLSVGGSGGNISRKNGAD
jgi:hypothetical protein